MTFRIVLEPSALRDIDGLPIGVVHALAVRTAELIDNPWDAQQLPKGSPAERWTTFGDDQAGWIEFTIDEHAETIRIIVVLWAG